MGKIIRVGECNRCGLCCISCNHVILEHTEKHTLQASCKLNPKPEDCENYPQYPDRLVSPSCAFTFIDEETGENVTTYRKNPILFEFFQPHIVIVLKKEKA